MPRYSQCLRLFHQAPQVILRDFPELQCALHWQPVHCLVFEQKHPEKPGKGPNSLQEVSSKIGRGFQWKLAQLFLRLWRTVSHSEETHRLLFRVAASGITYWAEFRNHVGKRVLSVLKDHLSHRPEPETGRWNSGWPRLDTNALERLTTPFFYLETELSLQNQTGWILHRKLN